jgi:peptidoglycan/LPS O-acetylase OafA/YrhL
MSKSKNKSTVFKSSAEQELEAKPAIHRFPELDGLRGLAALWVFALHVLMVSRLDMNLITPAHWLMRMGGTGVDVFFCLSAFLLTLPFLLQQKSGEAVDKKTFYLRRATRIFPAYWLQCLLLALIFYSGLSKEIFWYAPALADWIAHAFLYLNAWPTSAALNPVWWTLPVEYGFYLLLPLLIPLLRGKYWLLLLAIIGLSLLYRYGILNTELTRQQEIYWADHLPGRLFQFLLGMLAAKCFVEIQQRWKNFSPFAIDAWSILSLLLLLSLPTMGYLHSDQPYFGEPLKTLPEFLWPVCTALLACSLIFSLSFGRGFLSNLFSFSALRQLGTISFGIYLWHYPVLIILRSYLGENGQVSDQNIPMFFLLGLLITIAIAAASWRWLEAPLLRRVKSTSVAQ